MIVVVMGVTGAGKTTVGILLAQRLGWDFVDADSFHSLANVEKIRQGIPTKLWQVTVPQLDVDRARHQAMII